MLTLTTVGKKGGINKKDGQEGQLTDKSPEELAKLSAMERIYASYRIFLSSALAAVLLSVAVGAIAGFFYQRTASHNVSVPVADFVAMSMAIQTADRNIQTLSKILEKYPDVDANGPLAEMRQSTDAALKALTNIPGGMLNDVRGPSFVNSANAAPVASDFTNPEVYRPAVMVFMVATITLFLLLFVGLYLFTGDPEKIKFSASMIQTIIGFYVGVITGILGLPPTG
ncbi:hypothetical protein NKJ09_22065 [Mesorhizobium sp. M0189]|uniref:hypothetical protein n=1 Tax=unclassified Mesorhizobium TaxID=325217 RepID=UPI00333C0BDF